MDPISNRPPVNPAAAAQGPAASAATNAPFQVPAAGTNTPVQQPGSTPALTQIRADIQDALRVTQDRNQVIQHVINARLEREFGPQASPEMKQFVSEKLRNDPAFATIFAQVLS